MKRPDAVGQRLNSAHPMPEGGWGEITDVMEAVKAGWVAEGERVATERILNIAKVLREELEHSVWDARVYEDNRVEDINQFAVGVVHMLCHQIRNVMRTADQEPTRG